jgi:hypothetical protein
MGLILDSSVLISGERRGETVKQVIQRVQTVYGETESALSVIFQLIPDLKSRHALNHQVGCSSLRGN